MDLEYLKHTDGTKFLPVTHSDGVICEENKSLTTVIQELREGGGDTIELTVTYDDGTIKTYKIPAKEV